VQAHAAAGGTFSSWLDRVGNKVEMIASAAADKLSANVAKVSEAGLWAACRHTLGVVSAVLCSPLQLLGACLDITLAMLYGARCSLYTKATSGVGSANVVGNDVEITQPLCLAA
jgi:hypothetical protein